MGSCFLSFFPSRFKSSTWISFAFFKQNMDSYFNNLNMEICPQITESERQLNIKFIRQNVQQLHKLSYSSNIDFILNSTLWEWNIIFQLIFLNSVMNCENIHKKHTGSHLQNILNQKSWSEVKVKWMLLSEHTSIKMIKTATYEDLQRDTQTKAIHPPLTYQTPQLLLCGMKLLLHWRI